MDIWRFRDWTNMWNNELVEEVVQAISLKPSKHKLYQFNGQSKFKHIVWKQWLDLYSNLKKSDSIDNFGQYSSEVFGKMGNQEVNKEPRNE